MDPRAAHLARVANGHKSSNSSFDMDRAEGGQALVSSELHERLAAHGLADQDTLQEMWHFNIWSVADLAGVDTEVLVQVPMQAVILDMHAHKTPGILLYSLGCACIPPFCCNLHTVVGSFFQRQAV